MKNLYIRGKVTLKPYAAYLTRNWDIGKQDPYWIITWWNFRFRTKTHF